MRKCRICKQKYEPTRQMQTTCGDFDCMVKFADQAAAKNAAKRARVERKETREKLQKFVRLSVFEQKARKALQKYRRLYELSLGRTCISCGTDGSDLDVGLYGHIWDAGHFRSVGSAKHLSLEPDNIWLQCTRCNGRLGGNHIEFERGLIALKGREFVEALKADQRPRKYTREQLIELAEKYNKLARDLE